MTNSDPNIIAIYDDFMSRQTGGVSLSKTRDAIIPQIKDYLSKFDRDLDQEARDAFNVSVVPERERRSRSLKKNLEHLADMALNPEGYTNPDAHLSVAYRLGTAEGEDKLLRFWTAEDFRNCALSRYRTASNAMAEAREFDDIASRVIAAMNEGGARTLGDLFYEQPRAAA